MQSNWHDIRFAPLPTGVQIQVEVTNHTGPHKLPFNVIFDGTRLLNADKRVPADPTARVIKWRKA